MLFDCLGEIRRECRAVVSARHTVTPTALGGTEELVGTNDKDESAFGHTDEVFTRLCRAHQMAHQHAEEEVSSGSNACVSKTESVCRAQAQSDMVCAIDASRDGYYRDDGSRDETPLYAILPWMLRWSCLGSSEYGHAHAIQSGPVANINTPNNNNNNNNNNSNSSRSCEVTSTASNNRAACTSIDAENVLCGAAAAAGPRHRRAVLKDLLSNDMLKRLRSSCPRAVARQLLPDELCGTASDGVSATAARESAAVAATISSTASARISDEGVVSPAVACASARSVVTEQTRRSSAVRRSSSLPTLMTREVSVHDNAVRTDDSMSEQANASTEAAIRHAAMSSLSWPPIRQSSHQLDMFSVSENGSNSCYGGIDRNSRGTEHSTNNRVEDTTKAATMREDVDAATPRSTQDSTLDDFFGLPGASRKQATASRSQSSRKLHFAPIQTQAALSRRNSPPPPAYGGSSARSGSYSSRNSSSYSSYHNQEGTASSAGGGFISASEQLLADVKAGRAGALASALVSARSPALGLRRHGFQPPFHSAPPPQPPPPPAQTTQAATAKSAAGNHSSNNDSVDGSVHVHKVLAGMVNNTNTNNTNNTKSNNSNDSSDASAGYPASLLLPDGSVPALLQSLDPQLVSQVASEILESTAGKTSSITWDDIAGLQYAKESIEEAIVWPLRRPDLFVGLRDPPRGLLLFGPPGTGKTMIARAIAHEAECTFLNISASSIMSKWVGDGEKLVRCLFAVATVRQPSVIFVDEIDSLLSARSDGEMESVRRVKTEFLVQLDGVATDRHDRVLLIGATNRPDELDEAARRRLEKRLYIPLPDAAARRELIARLLFTLERDTLLARGARTTTATICSVTEIASAKESSGNDAAAPTHATVTGVSLDVCAAPPGTGKARVASASLPVSATVTNTAASSVPFSAPDGVDSTLLVHTLVTDDLIALAELSRGYSGADLKLLCREASMGPLREINPRELGAVKLHQLRPVGLRDFKNALRRIRPSVAAHEVTRYESWNAQYGSFNNSSSSSHGNGNGGDAVAGLEEEEYSGGGVEAEKA